jgi:hypothetical protein
MRGRSLPSSRRGDEFAIWLSALGERLGHDWLIYNPGIMRIYHRLARFDAGPVAEALAAEFPTARSWADVGAGTGAFAAAARRIGRRVVGCERSRVGRLFAYFQRVPTTRFDLTQTPAVPSPGIHVDLAYCLEVAEHLDPMLGARLVEFLAATAPIVVFTAAPPGQGGAGHVNEQPRDYWVALFEAQSMGYDDERSERLADSFRARGVAASWLTDNLMVFARTAS